MKDSYFPLRVMYIRPGQLTILISTTNRSSTCTRVVGLKEILRIIRIVLSRNSLGLPRRLNKKYTNKWIATDARSDTNNDYVQ